MAGLFFGLLVRLAALGYPGTGDTLTWRIWTHAATVGRVVELYGVGGTPLERRILEFEDAYTTIDYPPLILHELAIIGHIYEFFYPGFPDGPALRPSIKVLGLVADSALTWLLVWAVSRFRPGLPHVAYWAGLGWWLNPASVLTTSALGYLDSLFAWPAVAAVVAVACGWPLLGGALAAAAFLTKAQGVLIVPVVVVGLLRPAGRPDGWHWRGFSRGLAGMAGVTGLVVLPFVLRGSWPNLIQALESLTRHDLLSGQAANFWWAITWALRAWYWVEDAGWWVAFTSPVRRPLAISTVIQLGLPNVRAIGSLLVVLLLGWRFWRSRQAHGAFQLAALGAVITFTYFTFAAAVHENHLYLAVPLSVLAAAGLPGWRSVAVGLSAGVALNLNLFYGVDGRGAWAIPRTLTLIDATVWLSVALIGWWFLAERRIDGATRVTSR